MTTEPNRTLEYALKYAAAGIAVFPCNKEDKSPLIRDGHYGATTDEKKIRKWFTKHTDALIGGPTDQFLIVDCDLKHGRAAEHSHDALMPYIDADSPQVRTMNRGYHYYFKATPEVAHQKQKYLPHIDILSGPGGYTIMPDGDSYKAHGRMEQFIEKLLNLPALDSEIVKHINGEIDVPHLNVLSERKNVGRKKSKNNADLDPEVLESKKDENEEKMAKRAMERSDMRIYDSTIREFSTTSQEKYKGEAIKVGRKTMSSGMVVDFFFDRSIQKAMAKYLSVKTKIDGLKADDNRTKFQSLLPGHADRRASMGSRWAESSNQSHIIVRDFSNHFKDGYIDYNLVRLHSCIMHGYKQTNMRAPSFYVMFMDLMEKAGVVTFDIPRYRTLSGLTPTDIKVANGFLRLMAIKGLYKGGEDSTVYSIKFIAAWCNVSASAAKNAKQKMIKLGMMTKTGETAGVGKMQTDVYTLDENMIIRKDPSEAKEDADYASAKKAANKTTHAVKVTSIFTKKKPKKPDKSPPRKSNPSVVNKEKPVNERQFYEDERNVAAALARYSQRYD